MATEYAKLVLKVDALEAKNATKELDRLYRSGSKAERATDALGKSSRGSAIGLKVMAGATAGVVAAIAGLKVVTNVAVEFGRLNAQLHTATGSAEGAAVAFKAIQKFAANTPYDLQQATLAFTQLVNLGLDPSEKALVSYGNTASAMGKDLSQFIEAVADAATGEFERLKEFGIKSSKQGDQVAFTFRGLTTTIGNSAAEIEGYLQDLGNNEFAGSMERQMSSIGGAVSNFGDSWTQMVYEIGQAGLGSVIEDAIRIATSAIDGFVAMFKSGQLTEGFEAFFGQFDVYATDMAVTAENLMNEVISSFGGMEIGIGEAMTEMENDTADSFNSIGLSGENAKDYILRSFALLPTNFRYLVQRAAVELYFLVDHAKDIAGSISGAFAIEFQQIVSTAKVTAREIADALNVFDGDSYDADAVIATLNKEYNAAYDNLKTRNNEEKGRRETAKEETLQGIYEEHQAAVAAYDERITKGKELLKIHKETNSESGAVLGQFYKGAGPTEAVAKGAKGAAGGSGGNAKANAAQKEFDSLVASLRTEEEEIEDSYQRRSEIIERNTIAGGNQRNELESRLRAEYDADLNRAVENEKRIEAQKHQALIGGAAGFFGNLSALSKSENEKMAKIGQAAAIVETTINTYAAATAAYKAMAGIPYVGPALGVAAAGAAIVAGMANVSAIKSQSAGGYEHGGMIPAGKIGMLEGAPEFVRGPAIVTSQRATRDLLSGSSNTSAGGNSVNVNVFNNSGATVETKTRNNGNEVDIIISRIKSEVAGEIASGDGIVGSAFEEAYGVRRGSV